MFSFLLTLADICLEITLPEAWMALIGDRYSQFTLPATTRAEPHWRVRLAPGEVPRLEAPVILHRDDQSRFVVADMAGSIDPGGKSADILLANPARAAAAIDRVATYLCLITLPPLRRGLLIHAASVVRHGQGLLFAGHSGAGKTTVARLSTGHATLLGDENGIICPDGAGGYALWSTPFWGASTPPDLIRRTRQVVPLRAIFILDQKPDFELERLTPARAVLALIDSEKVSLDRPESADAWLHAAHQLLATCPCYRLGFRPTPDLWHFLDQVTAPPLEREEKQ
jgi:hypothetical protein